MWISRVTADYHDSTSCSNFYRFVCVFVYYMFRTIRNFIHARMPVFQSLLVYMSYMFFCVWSKIVILTIFNNIFLLNANHVERLIIRIKVQCYILCSTETFSFSAIILLLRVLALRVDKNVVFYKKTVTICGCYLVCFSPSLYTGLLPPGLGRVWWGVSVLRTRQERLPRITGIDWLSDWMIEWPMAWPLAWLICWTHCISIR